MLPLFKLGVGGRLGSGKQWWSFISLTDQVGALTALLDSDHSGPVNLTTPNPATNAEVTRVMGEALHRPTVLPVPAFALKAVLGEFSSEVLGSARVLPGKLTASEFPFAHPTFASAIRSVL